MSSKAEILSVIEAWAGDVPAAFLQALALRESGLNPLAVNPSSSAAGLFQITTPVLKDWNRAKGDANTRADLFDPEVATRVASFHVRQIIALWRGTPGLAENFGDRRFVELLVLGWNAGPSAVAKLARRLAEIGLPPERVTAEAVHEAAVATTPGSYVAMPERLAFARLVATTFDEAQGGRASRDRLIASARPSGPRGATAAPPSSAMRSLAPAIAAAVGVGAVMAAASNDDDDDPADGDVGAHDDVVVDTDTVLPSAYAGGER